MTRASLARTLVIVTQQMDDAVNQQGHHLLIRSAPSFLCLLPRHLSTEMITSPSRRESATAGFSIGKDKTSVG